MTERIRRKGKQYRWKWAEVEFLGPPPKGFEKVVLKVMETVGSGSHCA